MLNMNLYSIENDDTKIDFSSVNDKIEIIMNSIKE